MSHNLSRIFGVAHGYKLGVRLSLAAPVDSAKSILATASGLSLFAFAVDASSGTLTPLSTATFATGRGPSSIAVDAAGPFLYVANNGGSNNLSAFAIDPATGILTEMAGSPFNAVANPLSLAFGASGKFLYAANSGTMNSSISGFSVDAVSGTLTALSGSPFPLAVSHYLAAHPTGAYLYVTTGTGVVGYGIEAATGLLTSLPGFPITAGGNAYSVAIDPDNQFLYVTTTARQISRALHLMHRRADSS